MGAVGGHLQNMSYLRIARLAKALKLLRIIRILRTFRELRMVLDSVLGSMKAMLWTVLLISMIVFMFGICFVQAATDIMLSDQCWPERHSKDCKDTEPMTELSQCIVVLCLDACSDST